MGSREKTLSNQTGSEAQKNVRDLITFGDPDTFLLIAKASSKSEGWMKSTKAMNVGGLGVLVQVTTQQDQNVAEALEFIPNAVVVEHRDMETNELVGRSIVSKEVAQAKIKLPKLKREPESQEEPDINEADGGDQELYVGGADPIDDVEPDQDDHEDNKESLE